MKSIYLFLLTLCTFFVFPNQSFADRGDLISYEELDHFTNQDVKDYFADVFSGFYQS